MAQNFELRQHLPLYRGLQAGRCADRVISLKPKTLLDVGCGDQLHAKLFRQHAIKVTTLDLTHDADHKINFLEFDGGLFDIIWLSHVLEHVRNPGQFIDKAINHLAPGGFVAVTVPPLKTQLVGGHINLFTMGTLCYQLILSGLACDWGQSYGYNLSVIASIAERALPKLVCDCGDIETLTYHFPYRVKQNANGNLHDWDNLNALIKARDNYGR